MPRLEDLRLFATGVDADRLFELPLPELRVLRLDHGRAYPLDRLAANPTLANLTALLCHPHGLEYGDAPYIQLDGLRALCRSPHLARLSELRLRLTDFGDAGVDEVVDSGLLRRLTALDLRGGCVTDAGARRLAACDDARNLKSLDLSRNALSHEGIRALAAAGVRLTARDQHGERPPFRDGYAPTYLSEGAVG